MIKAIFFDFDGVLSTISKGSAVTAQYLSNKTSVDFDELLAKKWGRRLEVISGKIREADLWRNIFAEYDVKFKEEWATEAYASTPIDEEMVSLALKLKENYKIGIISDNFIERFDVILGKNDCLNIFDRIVLSETIGSGKEDTKIFEYACKELSVKPEECVFIDNVQKNLIPCNQVGMHGVYFDDKVRDYEKLEKEIEAII